MSNPVLNADRWQLEVDDARSHANPVMTVNGAVTKTFGLLAIVIATLAVMWSVFWTDGQPLRAVTPWMITGAIAGLVLVLVGMFAPRWAMVVAPNAVRLREILKSP